MHELSIHVGTMHYNLVFEDEEEYEDFLYSIRYSSTMPVQVYTARYGKISVRPSAVTVYSTVGT